MADLDAVTDRLQQRIHSGTFPLPQPVVSRHAGLNSTCGSNHTQPETETSALTNSHQFLPLPAEGMTTSTEGELKVTGDSVITNGAPMLSSMAMTLRLEDNSALCGTGSSTLVSGLVHDAVGGLLGTGGLSLHGSGEDNMTPRDSDTSRAQSDPLLRYSQHQPQTEMELPWQLDDNEGGTGGGAGFERDYADMSCVDEGDLIVPRALNDISNVNFNNTAQRSTTQECPSKLSEEDSWFSCGSPNRRPPQSHSARDDHTETLPEGLKDLDSGPGVEEWLGGTASTLGTVGEDDPYGRTLLGGHFNRTMKLTLNYEDSWASQVPSDVDHEPHLVEKSPSESTDLVIHSQRSLPSLQDSDKESYPQENSQEKSERGTEYTEEEQSLILEENPTAFSPISRTSRRDSDTSKSQRGRKAAVFRREYEKHRTAEVSSDEDNGRKITFHSQVNFSSDSDENRSGSQSRRRKPTKRKTSKLKESLKNSLPHTNRNCDKNTHQVHSKGLASPPSNSSDNDSDVSADIKSLTVQTPPEYSDLSKLCAEPHRCELVPHKDLDGVSKGVTLSDEHRCPESGSDSSHKGQDMGTSSSVKPGGTLATHQGASCTVPNFFLPTDHLEQTMRALRTQVAHLIYLVIVFYTRCKCFIL